MVTEGIVLTPDGEPAFAFVIRNESAEVIPANVVPGLGFRRPRGNDLLAKDPAAGASRWMQACVWIRR